uniref:Uncharacterized protein n=1 Tax=Romanomermis culicivorax TaxID=13658 RepID=A0A915J385_ROMCU
MKEAGGDSLYLNIITGVAWHKVKGQESGGVGMVVELGRWRCWDRKVAVLGQESGRVGTVAVLEQWPSWGTITGMSP